MPRTVAFFSYTRRDDNVSQGLLSKIRETLEGQVGAYLGERIEIFQDMDNIKTGDDWERKLENALATATFLIPILTPSLFRSEFCRREVQRFFDREDQLERGEMVLPVYFRPILDYSKSVPDELVARCAARQHLDWVTPNFRRKRDIDDKLWEAIDTFAEEIANKVWAADAVADKPIGTEAARSHTREVRTEQAEAKRDLPPRAETPTVDIRKATSSLDEIEEARTEPKWKPAPPAGADVDTETKPSPATATKQEPFVNSLGMKFVPVPITGGPTDGERVLFNIWETRVQDYAAFAKDNPGVNSEWKDVVYEGEKQGPTHPVVNVSWEDAIAFCAWLTGKEREAGLLDSQQEYRLPTDYEWSCAVGIGGKEKADSSPAEKHRKFQDFPWDASGKQWPPPPGAGNFGEIKVGLLARLIGTEGYQDPYAFTAPVGSFNENSLGLFDLSGNVWEWCEDFYLKNKRAVYRVLRGGSWGDRNPERLRSSCRNITPALRRGLVICGFRCVVGAVGRLSAR